MIIAHAGKAVVLAGALAAIGVFSGGPGLDETTTSAIAPASGQQARFMLVSAGDETACTLVAEEAPHGTMRQITLAPDCLAAGPELAAMRFWLDRPDGTVALAGADGRVRAEFALADGAAYESYNPRFPVMTLLAAE
jgi:hypothetical protein